MSRSARWEAYADTLLQIETPAGSVQVVRAPLTWTSGDYLDPEGRTVHVVTAHNPGGRVAGVAANAAAKSQLEAELDRRPVVWWPAAGGDACWSHVEANAAVLGLDDDEARALGAAYGQEVIFALTPTVRQVLDCRTRRCLATGWSLHRLGGGTAAVATDTATLTYDGPGTYSTEPGDRMRTRTDSLSVYPEDEVVKAFPGRARTGRDRVRGAVGLEPYWYRLVAGVAVWGVLPSDADR